MVNKLKGTSRACEGGQGDPAGRHREGTTAFDQGGPNRRRLGKDVHVEFACEEGVPEVHPQVVKGDEVLPKAEDV